MRAVLSERAERIITGLILIELNLPLPPSANHIWVRARKGMRYSDKYKIWKDEAGWSAKSQTRERIAGPYKLAVQIVRPDKRRRDIDNFAFKAINDLLVSLQIVDDDHLCEMVTARWVTVGQGVTVRIEPAGVE